MYGITTPGFAIALALPRWGFPSPWALGIHGLSASLWTYAAFVPQSVLELTIGTVWLVMQACSYPPWFPRGFLRPRGWVSIARQVRKPASRAIG